MTPPGQGRRSKRESGTSRATGGGAAGRGGAGAARGGAGGGAGRPAARGGAGGASGRQGAAGRRRAGADRGSGGGRGATGAAARHDLGGEQVEGRRAVRELLAARRRAVHEVWVADGVAQAGIVDEIVALAETVGVPVRHVVRGRLDAMARTDAPQGVLALAAPLTEASLEDLVGLGERDGGARAAAPFLLVLDGVTDPHNLGALLRSAECAGATGVVLPRHRAAHVTPTVTKAAAGALEHLPIAVVAGIPSALQTLGDAGVWTVGLDAAGPGRLWDLDLASQPVAVVLGAEGRGLSRLARARCDVVVAIPQTGAIDSLNVSAAGALALFEVARRRA